MTITEGRTTSTTIDVERPCPFCRDTHAWMDKTLRDGAAPEDDGAFAFNVRCNSCAAQGPWTKNDTGALRMWNRRPRR